MYIDADEDHISEQVLEEDADGKKRLVAGKATIIGKMVYLYEGIEKEHTKSRRKRLIGKHYFGGVYEGKDNERLWREVSEYIEAVYDTGYLKKVYINGDGADWIKAGIHQIPKGIFVLDRYHLMKYINQATSHMKERKETEKGQIYEAINGRHRSRIPKIFDGLREEAGTEAKEKAVTDSENYILNNWRGITVRIGNKEVIGCSAEGHVSHVYSSRMSSRPMGWSRHGADQMCRLRCYKENGGSILELVKRQRELRETVQEERAYRLMDIIGKEAARKYKNDGYYIEKCQAKISGMTAKKQLWFSRHILEF